MASGAWRPDGARCRYPARRQADRCAEGQELHGVAARAGARRDEVRRPAHRHPGSGGTAGRRRARPALFGHHEGSGSRRQCGDHGAGRRRAHQGRLRADAAAMAYGPGSEVEDLSGGGRAAGARCGRVARAGVQAAGRPAAGDARAHAGAVRKAADRGGDDLCRLAIRLQGDGAALSRRRADRPRQRAGRGSGEDRRGGEGPAQAHGGGAGPGAGQGALPVPRHGQWQLRAADARRDLDDQIRGLQGEDAAAARHPPRTGDRGRAGGGKSGQWRSGRRAARIARRLQPCLRARQGGRPAAVARRDGHGHAPGGHRRCAALRLGAAIARRGGGVAAGAGPRAGTRDRGDCV